MYTDFIFFWLWVMFVMDIGCFLCFVGVVSVWCVSVEFFGCVCQCCVCCVCVCGVCVVLECVVCVGYVIYYVCFMQVPQGFIMRGGLAKAQTHTQTHTGTDRDTETHTDTGRDTETQRYTETQTQTHTQRQTQAQTQAQTPTKLKH